MSDKSDKPDLDLIQMVQNARMMHDDEAQPSQVPGVYWIEAKRQPGEYPEPTSRMGEWRVHTTVDVVDEIWAKIKQATQAGHLGYKSKVSTTAAQGQGHRDQRLICVRTYDADDSADVDRVRQALLKLGIAPDTMHYERM
ncbi:MAG: DUF1917 domain-containing protein [Anaerolineae bacterium]|nr:DUF1917 domain-containing protein [Anaerolineae bacterium]